MYRFCMTQAKNRIILTNGNIVTWRTSANHRTPCPNHSLWKTFKRSCGKTCHLSNTFLCSSRLGWYCLFTMLFFAFVLHRKFLCYIYSSNAIGGFLMRWLFWVRKKWVCHSNISNFHHCNRNRAVSKFLVHYNLERIHWNTVESRLSEFPL